ncbi:MAG: hypothetical protein ACLFWM_13290 [Actinomycetota bacterium]
MSEPSVILVDVPEGGTVDVGFLEDLGHPVTICHGPGPGTLCPILTGEGCPKAESAHGIVFALDLDRPQHRKILERYKATLPEDVPIDVVASPDQAQHYHQLLADVRVLTALPGIADLDGLAAEVEAADRS